MKIFNRWNGKVRIEAKVYKGEIVCGIEKDGKVEGGTMAQVILAMVSRLGELAGATLADFERSKALLQQRIAAAELAKAGMKPVGKPGIAPESPRKGDRQAVVAPVGSGGEVPAAAAKTKPYPETEEHLFTGRTVIPPEERK
jgi:hypothetical protein